MHKGIRIHSNITRIHAVVIFFAICVLLSTGCANLETVRNFAKQSASLTSGTEAIDYWGKWDDRSKSFDEIIAKLPSKGGSPPIKLIGPISAPSKEELDSIKALQAVLSAYMDKLGSLAEDDIVDVSKQVDGLVENLDKLPTNLPEDKQNKINSAYGTIIKLVKLPLDAYRHYKVRQLIRENDKNIEQLTYGLSISMNSVSKFVGAEKDSVLNWYEIITSDYPAPSNFQSAYHWKKDKDSIVQAYAGKTKAITDYKNALETIKKSHSEMAKDLSMFNTKSFKILISSLKDAQTEISNARDQYKEAFE